MFWGFLGEGIVDIPLGWEWRAYYRKGSIILQSTCWDFGGDLVWIDDLCVLGVHLRGVLILSWEWTVEIERRLVQPTPSTPPPISPYLHSQGCGELIPCYYFQPLCVYKWIHQHLVSLSWIFLFLLPPACWQLGQNSRTQWQFLWSRCALLFTHWLHGKKYYISDNC